MDEQHPSCHWAWKAYLDGDSSGDDGSVESDNSESSPEDLIFHLGTMARRDVLRLTCMFEGSPRSSDRTTMVPVH